MRLTVNGVPVRVVDRIEIVLEVPEEGDTLLNGFELIAKGGTLRIESGCKAQAVLASCEGLRADPNGIKLHIIGNHDFNLWGYHPKPESTVTSTSPKSPS